MYPIPPTETLAETKTCKHCGANFPITDQDLEFYDKISPAFASKKCPIPSPTLCPDCRQQRRLSFRNERKLYKRKCDATGEIIVSIYSPDKPFKVYHRDYWWSDKWDPLDYGRDFDFTRPFFEQFGELLLRVPKIALAAWDNENSEYVHDTANCKNCYLVFGSYEANDCAYSTTIWYGAADSIDNLWILDSQRCYECVHVEKCFNCTHCLYSTSLTDCRYLKYCHGCQNCFGCVGLTNKKFHIFNTEYGEKEYFQKLEELERCGDLKGRVAEFQKTCTYPLAYSMQSENVVGDIFSNSRNCFYAFSAIKTENAKYAYDLFLSGDVYDAFNAEAFHSYEVVSAYRSSHVLFLYYAQVGNFMTYCIECITGCTHLFGCAWLRNKSYCIFNKQYTKEQYEELVPKIIEHMMKTGEWGEFFPSWMSPFGYNETVAMDHFPLTREEALAKNFNWSGYEPPFPKVEKTIPAAKLPERIEDVPDDILNWAIECEVTKKPFRIIKQELEFYRKHHLPIPKRHPDQRHLDRMALRNPRKLFERTCDCPDCAKNNKSPDGKPVKFLTTYSPKSEELVYCETCYEKEVR